MPKLAAFPKAYMDPLVLDGSMTIRQWVDLATTLDIDGLEFYSGFLELKDPKAWAASRNSRERDLAGTNSPTIPFTSAYTTHAQKRTAARKIAPRTRMKRMTPSIVRCFVFGV